jgi:hypothetical protein
MRRICALGRADDGQTERQTNLSQTRCDGHTNVPKVTTVVTTVLSSIWPGQNRVIQLVTQETFVTVSFPTLQYAREERVVLGTLDLY